MALQKTSHLLNLMSNSESVSDKQMSKISQRSDKIDEELSHYHVLVRFEAITGISKVYLVGFFIGLFALMVARNYAGCLLSNLLGWIYPFYASFKAIGTSNKEGDTQWLTYWCVLGFLYIVESFSDYLLYKFPLYYLAKSAFLFWLFHGDFRGAELIYKKFLRETLIQATPVIDSYIGRAKEVANDICDKIKQD